MFHNENKLIFALKRKFVVVGLCFFVCFFFFFKERTEEKGRREVTRSCLGWGGRGGQQGWGRKPCRAPEQAQGCPDIRQETEGSSAHWMDGWMDGWMNGGPFSDGEQTGNQWPCPLATWPLRYGLSSTFCPCQKPTSHRGGSLFPHSSLSL